jgi:head-tail adaptor
MGGKVEGWQAFATVWAKVWPTLAGATERMEGGEISAVAAYQFTIRRRVDVLATMRVVWPVDPVSGNDIPASKQFNLRAVNLPTSRELYMTLEAETGVAM